MYLRVSIDDVDYTKRSILTVKFPLMGSLKVKLIQVQF